jgi:phosphate transport system substrate-binding protein
MNKHAFALGFAALAFAGPVAADETSGAGSTFVYPVMAKWITDYAAQTGIKVNYEPVGSGLGIKRIKEAVVDFGATDMPLKPEELNKLGMGQFPLVIGGVVPIVNIDAIESGGIRFTGALLADIYLGKIKNWHDPAIQGINPGLKLPDLPITVVHRIDGSGTTFNWSNFLAKTSPDWKTKVGEGTMVEWPVGVGRKGNDGVASLVDVTPGSIGYIEYAFALGKKGLAFGLVQNQAGNFVGPSVGTFKAAASSADWISQENFLLIMTNAPGEQSYPITAAVFILMYKQPRSPERSAAALDFFKWALESGQTQAEALSYVSLPSTLVQQIKTYWKAQIAGWKG